MTKTETPGAESMTDIAHFSKILADRRIEKTYKAKTKWEFPSIYIIPIFT